MSFFANPEGSDNLEVANGNHVSTPILFQNPCKQGIDTSGSDSLAKHLQICRQDLQWWYCTGESCSNELIKRCFSIWSWRSFSRFNWCSPLLQWWGKATLAWSSEIWLLRFRAGSSEISSLLLCPTTALQRAPKRLLHFLSRNNGNTENFMDIATRMHIRIERGCNRKKKDAHNPKANHQRLAPNRSK